MGAETPLYGAAVLDWKAATAPVSLSEPVPPNSLDPVYPGVLVWLDSRRTLILIGTLSNIRNGNTWEDGAGIALDVIDQSAGRLRGDWNRWGIIGFSSGGSGYFCLDPV
ncbi:MAG: hypothetical protein LBG44_05585 [Gemmatimonadota bacterium]|jgi:hypothetical protein|nr:hypothetical protein [Gemmatimonadota bacterium]